MDCIDSGVGFFNDYTPFFPFALVACIMINTMNKNVYDQCLRLFFSYCTVRAISFNIQIC